MIHLTPLKDIAEFIRTGKTPPTKDTKYFNGEIQWFTPGDLDKGKFLLKSARTLTDEAFKDKKAAQFPPNTLLVACIGDIGKLGITTKECSSNQQITGIKPKENIDVSYLYYWFMDKKALIQNTANNAVVPILNNKTLEQIKVPLPPFVEQQKIAAILDAADSLRQKDQQLVERYTALSQSLFLEMFGDPEYSSYKKDTLENLFGKGEYGTSSKAIEFNCDKPRYIRITDIDDEGSLKNNRVSADIQNSEIQKYKLGAGDLVFARSGATVGKTYLYSENDGDLVYAGYLIKFKITKPFEPKYFFYFTKTKYYKKWIEKIQNVVAQPNVNAKQFGQDLLIPIPPIGFQNQFAERIQLIEAQKQQAQRSLEKSEALFNSLLQRAFTGELTAKLAA